MTPGLAGSGARPPVRLLGVLAVVALLAAGPGCPPVAAERVFVPDAPTDTPYRLTPSLSFGAELDLEVSFRRLELRGRSDREVALVKPELALAWSFDPAAAFQAFLNVSLLRPFVPVGNARDADEREAVGLELDEAYVRAGRADAGPSIQIGRQFFEDERKWLYDEDLDAVRVRYVRDVFTAEVSASRTGLVKKDLLAPRDREEERINTYVLHATLGLPKSIVLEGAMEAYAIVRDDRKTSGQRPVFVGLRSSGEPIEDLDYWFELGHVGGREDSIRVSGWGIDAGVVYELQVAPKPSIMLGLAYGTGDGNPDDARDTSFRQTGLHSNEGDFGGAVEFRYYGEVLDPELGNLLILTVGLGIHPTDQFSLDVVYHHYLQANRVADELRNAAISTRTSGRSRRIGSEIDIIIGAVELWNRVEIKLAAGYFFPGAALRRVGGAWVAGSQAQFRF